MSRFMRQVVLNLVKGILLYSNGQGVAKMNLDAENVTEALRKLRSFLLRPLFYLWWGNGIILRWVGRGWSSHGGEWGRDLAARRTSESSEDPLGLKAMGFEGHLPMSCIHVRFSLHPEVGITVSNISKEVVREESVAVWVLCSWIWSNMR